MAEDSYKIRIGTIGDTSGADQVSRSLEHSKAAANDFADSLKLGFGIDIAGKLVDSIGRIPGILESALRRGVQWNAEMGDSELAIAKIIGRFQNLDETASRNAAAAAIQQIVDLEPKTAGTLNSLVQGFSATAAEALSAGMSIRENIDLVAKFANVASNLKIPQEQLPQELRSILSGNITADSAIAKTLKISNSDITQAKELGNLYQFLAEKIGTLGEAGDSFGTRVSTLTSTMDKALGVLSKATFEDLAQSLVDINEALQDPQILAQLEQMGLKIGDIVDNGLELTEWAVRNADVLADLAETAGVVAIAFAAIKIKDIVVGLTAMTFGLGKSTVGLDTETAALARNTVAHIANTGARGANAALSAAGSASRFVGGMTAGDFIPADMIRLGPAQGAVTTAAARGTLRQFLPTVGRSISNVVLGGGGMGAALTGVGLGYEAQDKWFNWLGSAGLGGATSMNDLRKAQSRAGDKTLTEFFKRAQELTSMDDRDALRGDVWSYLSETKIQRGRMSWNETGQKKILDADIASAQRLLETLDRINEARIKGNTVAEHTVDIERQAVEAAEKRSKDIEALNKYKDERSDAFGLDQRAKATDEAVEAARKATEKGSPSTALRDRIAALKKELSANPEITASDAMLEDVQRRDAIRDQIKAQLDQLAKAEAARSEDLEKNRSETSEENGRKRIAGLRDEIALVEALGDKRIAELGNLKASEDDMASRRIAIEEDVATKRKALLDQIAGIEKQSETERAATQARFDAERIRRSNDLASIEHQSAEERARVAWERGFSGRQGRIDARSQRTIGLGGEVLVEKGQWIGGTARGVESARSGGSRLDAFATETALRRGISLSGLLAPAQRPSGHPISAQGSQPAQPNAAAQAADQLAATLKAVDASISKGLGGATAQAAAINAHAQASFEAVIKQLGAISKDMAALKSRIDNAREATA